MTKKSLNQRIIQYLDRAGVWISGDYLEKLSQQAGYKASYGSRECRKLAEDGKIDKEIRGQVYYRSLSPKKKVIKYVELPEGVKQIITYE